jgi:hypothetical protein
VNPRLAAAAVLTGLAALVATGAALRREARAWSPHPRSEHAELERSVGALAAWLPAEVRVVGWRELEHRADRFQLAQYALVPRLLVHDAASAWILLDASDEEAAQITRKEGLTPVAQRAGFHLLRRAAP